MIFLSTDLENLKLQVRFLKEDKYQGPTAILIITKIRQAMDQGISQLQLGITKYELLKIEERHTVLPKTEKVLITKDQARALAKKFGDLWQQSKGRDGDAKMDILKEMFKMWDQINLAIHNKLITNQDLEFESASEYFSVQHEMHEIETLMNLFGNS